MIITYYDRLLTSMQQLLLTFSVTINEKALDIANTAVDKNQKKSPGSDALSSITIQIQTRSIFGYGVDPRRILIFNYLIHGPWPTFT